MRLDFQFSMNREIVSIDAKVWKQKWNPDKFGYKCKELADWSFCKYAYMSNPSKNDCE